MKEATSSNVIKFLQEEIFNKFTVSKVIHSNKAEQFLSKQFGNSINQSVLNAVRI